jgi:putative ABC transport system ATP-binding protein
MPVIEAENLQKNYRLGENEVQALAGLDFQVQKGEFVAIMGPSGSGKSTLLHLLGGLDKPSHGEITLAGMQLSLLNDNEVTLARRHQVGFIFQFFNLVPTLTAEENILLPIIIDGKNPVAHRPYLEDLLTLVGLQDRRHHRPDQLSGGEQQRVSIARALITKPAIILADEPTGNLDSKNGTAIIELLARSCQELDQTIIIVTHDPKAASYAQRVVFLKDGHILFEIAHPASSQAERLARLLAEIQQHEL